MAHPLRIGMPVRETANGPLMVVVKLDGKYASCNWDENGTKYHGQILVSKLHEVPMEEILGDDYCR